MQKHTFVRKNPLIGSDISQSDLKENCLSKSSYVSTDMLPESLGRQSVMNNLSAMNRPSYQNERMTALIQAKRSTGFDSQKVSSITK